MHVLLVTNEWIILPFAATANLSCRPVHLFVIKIHCSKVCAFHSAKCICADQSILLTKNSRMELEEETFSVPFSDKFHRPAVSVLSTENFL
jgi:hypothetical protein